MADLKDKASKAIDNAANPTEQTTHAVVDESKAAVHDSGRKIERKESGFRTPSGFWPPVNQ
jgi:hypothetical protein